MIGIISFGAYLPILRMDREIIAKNWGRASIGGERSVAQNDEDSVTMAVEAARNCLKQTNRETVQALYFATTTAPYQEKLNAALIAAAVDLEREIVTIDFSNSLRAGTGAIRCALDSVKAGSMQNVLITAADSRLGYPGSDQEQEFGDGAAALLVGERNPLATYEGSYSICNEMTDVWRNPDDRFVRSWEARFVVGEGYHAHMKEAVLGILKRYQLNANQVAKAIFPAPNLRAHERLVRELGFNPETQVQDDLLSHVGHCGVAHSLLMFVAALEESKPGDILLLANYADGVDAQIFKVKRKIGNEDGRLEVRDFLKQKMSLSSYARFLSYKGLVETAPGEPFRLIPSASVTWRDRNSILRCHGSRCNSCGTMTYPIQRICYMCGSKDDFTEVRIADMEGKVFTFTRDQLAGRSDDPVVIQTIVELGKERVRFYGMMTDADPLEVEVGMPVTLTFRRIYEGAGMHNYFWKCKPIREKRS